MHCPPNENRTDFVLPDSTDISCPVGEVREDASQVADVKTELFAQSPMNRDLDRLAGPGVSTATVRPDSRPGGLCQRPTGEKNLSAVIEKVQRERQVQWGVFGVNVGSVVISDRLAVVIEEDHLVVG
jgi:hypothetical protein